MVFVRENFFYREIFSIEKNVDKELIAIYIWELVLDRHFLIRTPIPEL